jgi:hypothetical protein
MLEGRKIRRMDVADVECGNGELRK